MSGDMKTMMDCPFCGDHAFSGTTLDNSHYVMCRAEDCWAMTGYLPTKDEAIAAWNRRPSLPAGDMETLVERLKAERDEAFRANERDRSIIADARSAFSDALSRRSWLLQGRGSYEWDDDRWKAEFGEAIEELRAPLDVLGKIGIDWSLCPTSPEEIAAARIDWKSRTEASEARAKELGKALEGGVDFEAFTRWLRPWVKDRFGVWITHNTAKGAYTSLSAALLNVKDTEHG